MKETTKDTITMIYQFVFSGIIFMLSILNTTKLPLTGKAIKIAEITRINENLSLPFNLMTWVFMRGIVGLFIQIQIVKREKIKREDL